MIYRNGLSHLDIIRLSQNKDQFRETFRELAEKNKQYVLQNINEEKLRFPSLFILIPEIEALNLYEDLNTRNIIALETCAKTLNNYELINRLGYLSQKDSNNTKEALNWLLQTGVEDELEEDNKEYDTVLDNAAALLTKKYEEKTVLPVIADLIFKRNRKGLYIHDLVWSFFQTLDPSALKLVANNLHSANEKDVELACKLLHLNPPESNDRASKHKMFKDYLLWLKENSPFLYLTGEHFQLTSKPEPINVDLEAKYLCKKISYRNRYALEPLTENEIECLDQFRKIPSEDQKILATYSCKIHERDIQSWLQWIQKKPEEQINIAKQARGVIR